MGLRMAVAAAASRASQNQKIKKNHAMIKLLN
jgi:hypothetical protein